MVPEVQCAWAHCRHNAGGGAENGVIVVRGRLSTGSWEVMTAGVVVVNGVWALHYVVLGPTDGSRRRLW